jgi:glucose-6-phosphate 1-dehydrogenase
MGKGANIMNNMRPKSTEMVIFGAGGDLTWRKLMPALYDLFLDQWLPEQFAIIGVDRKAMNAKKFHQRLREGVDRFSRHGATDAKNWKAFSSYIVEYISADFSVAETYHDLAKRLDAREQDWGVPATRLFYLATPPSMVEVIAPALHDAGLVKDSDRSRIVVEKPFGRDLESAQALNRLLEENFEEKQIYRIDHYLGKETVQNILAFRFANALFEPLWDRRYIDHIQITVAEQVGIEHRGAYYEKAGALRDMIQNHLLQILCLIAMEPPVSFNDDEIRNKKVDVLRAIRPISVEEAHLYAARGQYGAGWEEGEKVPGYRQEPDVSPDSNTETFAALKLFVDNWRWQGIPFYLRTGKRLPVRASEVVIQFRPVPHQSFPSASIPNWHPNRLVIRIQPRESIMLRFQAKEPGPHLRLSPVEMRFCYADAFHTIPPEAYETLLLDAMLGDATLFMRADQVEAAWSIITPVLQAWEKDPPVDFPNYRASSWGPEVAEVLIAQDGRSWILPGMGPDDDLECGNAEEQRSSRTARNRTSAVSNDGKEIEKRHEAKSD